MNQTESPHSLYFIADIASNHDGSLQKAVDLIHKAAECGANAAKFQNFNAETIVSKQGFSSIAKNQASHQAHWKDSVFNTYKKASIPLEWTPTLRRECDKAGIDYLTSPYDIDIIDYLSSYVSAWKIGSGDITWLPLLRKLSSTSKLLILATGASSLDDVIKAVTVLDREPSSLVLMQCNTNYTGSQTNYRYINLNVLKSYASLFPGVTLGLSDHTPTLSTVLGAIALGATYIEKHFTFSNDCEGPDHAFSITPERWTEMVDRSIELSLSLGGTVKKVEHNELETVVLQRRSLRTARALQVGHIVSLDDIVALRPAPKNSLTPFSIGHVIGSTVTQPLQAGDVFTHFNIARDNDCNSDPRI
jgi:sialic acid synthase SpsE